MTTLKQKKELIEELIKRRKEIGINQSNLAFAIRSQHPDIKISQATISRVESGNQDDINYSTIYYWNKTLEYLEKTKKL